MCTDYIIHCNLKIWGHSEIPHANMWPDNQVRHAIKSSIWRQTSIPHLVLKTVAGRYNRFHARISWEAASMDRDLTVSPLFIRQKTTNQESPSAPHRGLQASIGVSVLPLPRRSCLSYLSRRKWWNACKDLVKQTWFSRIIQSEGLPFLLFLCQWGHTKRTFQCRKVICMSNPRFDECECKVYPTAGLNSKNHIMKVVIPVSKLLVVSGKGLYDSCNKAFPTMPWGEGLITDLPVLPREYFITVSGWDVLFGLLCLQNLLLL